MVATQGDTNLVLAVTTVAVGDGVDEQFFDDKLQAQGIFSGNAEACCPRHDAGE